MEFLDGRKTVFEAMTFVIDGDHLERSDQFQIHSKIKSQVADRLTSRDCYLNAIFLSNPENIREFYLRFSELITDLSNKSIGNSTCNSVYGLEISLSRMYLRTF